MGTRAVVVVCQNEETAKKPFGIVNEGIGIYYTRTGRRFFGNSALETQLLARINAALKISGFWEKFSTDWVCLDSELMPWSAKAQTLLRKKYAPVGVA
ncbi:protein serine-threonine phosphatase [Richelia intracellularis]|nr:protein serine-threonine phosphatase [Richelia intracellularis]